MNSKIYEAIAQEYGVSVEEVIFDMNAAIAEAYSNSKERIPTPAEFIVNIAKQIREAPSRG